jgi:putative Holliday junction resolvase
MGSYRGIDFGRKRIGVAGSDENGRIAFPLCVIQNAGGQPVIKEISRIAAERKAEKIIVGLPLNLDGSKGLAVGDVEQFASRLKTRVALPVEFWDERLSTKIAERAMIDGGLSRRRRRQSIDRVAAQIMLQSYLDAHGNEKCSVIS